MRQSRLFRILLFTGMNLILVSAHAQVSTERQTALIHLLRHDCGSCHGMTLKGGLGPSLLPGNLRSRDPAYLRHIISDGIDGTAMPPWSPLLTEDDIDYLVHIILNPVQESAQ